MMTTKTILTCALTGSVTPPKKHLGLPITPKEIAESGIEAAKAGAAIVHIHVRDPEKGIPSMDPELYREVVDRIRDDGTDVVINLTCGHGARLRPSDPDANDASGTSNVQTPVVRMRHIEENKPEICTLDYGSMNFGDFVIINTPEHLKRMAEIAKKVGSKPELEVFDTGHLRLAKKMIEEGIIDKPPLFQICLGIPWGLEQNSESMIFMRDALPDSSHWASFGIGPGEFPMLAQAALLGGHVRVGMEDNLYLEKGVPTPSNAALVEKGIKILQTLGKEPASAQEAREILGLKKLVN
ncbi:MAG: 3-keto-5-aminohexanoate cleavage enzyme [Alphaproteobacteria bacterium MarineAlpha3_Bin7]|nr:MAG: 3-keto-5-aminohexanoate cleavage enzyme [Alphaproteobacteria bacterium MarineAlpha3_Bin7]|tara:strand:- start:845 stop:1735 length:891 start_codon:yes stop_codon:yes gene_type:complete